MLNHIGIIGEGKMGTNLFYYLLDMDLNLTWLCSPDADPDKLRKNLDKKMSRSLQTGILDEARYKNILDHVNITKSHGDLASSELIIEAIPEDTGLKKELFRTLDTMVSPGCIFASNSSSIRPADLIPSEERKDKFIGLHFFYPVALRDIVEIMVTPETSEETMHRIVLFLNGIKRRFLVLADKESFILNRIFLGFQNEAYHLVDEKKAGIQQIDRIVKEHFFPTGVFEFFDSVGLDVMLASVRNYSGMDPGGDRYQPLIEGLQALVSSGRLGSKTKSGFYTDGNAADTGFPENDNLIIERLRRSWAEAFHHFSGLSGIPPEKLKSALDEYFGAETPPVC